MPRLANIPSITQHAGGAEMARVLAEVRVGKVRCTGTVTLAAGTTSTLVRDSLFGAGTVLALRPTTAGGAALKTWQAATGKGSITVGHDAPGADQPFLWTALG